MTINSKLKKFLIYMTNEQNKKTFREAINITKFQFIVSVILGLSYMVIYPNEELSQNLFFTSCTFSPYVVAIISSLVLNCFKKLQANSTKVGSNILILIASSIILFLINSKILSTLPNMKTDPDVLINIFGYWIMVRIICYFLLYVITQINYECRSK